MGKIRQYYSLRTTITCFSLFVCSGAAALDHNVSLSYSYPSAVQNIDIEKVELTYSTSDYSISEYLPIYLYPLLNIGQLQTSGGDGEILGAGGGVNYYLNYSLRLFGEGGVYWLSNYEFGEPGVAFKDYGGPIQFYYKVGSSFALSKDIEVGLAYQHMSNANRYDINPALNSIQLSFQYSF
ncbi:acyloxyacyl hydrolase [Thalassotalea sp. PS06]|uniref:acyloxyacyl hydrolase n=1 Tax=Thalassotalea sp. PS06 TaxID=2594005 RepID=UPI00163D536D|nr:acyloxyacyl hydrolase [Thalassotalea sp. PS06]